MMVRMGNNWDPSKMNFLERFKYEWRGLQSWFGGMPFRSRHAIKGGMHPFGT